ncbi:nucleotidyltransferase family protein [Fundidesulfovibrio butyratiphilus]
MRVLKKGSLRIGLVVNEERRLLGTVTDGDVRDAILLGVSLEAPVRSVMCVTPVVARPDDSPDTLLALMRRRDVLQVPLVDEAGHILGLCNLSDLTSGRPKTNQVVLMAGGLGERLRPLTAECPKPMLSLGNKPILEIILDTFVQQGFSNFTLAVNYKAEMLMNHFGDGSRFGASITYLRENKRLGTAGALSLLPERPSEPFFVMNGDILTKTNFVHLLSRHQAGHSAATMCLREYEFQVPYGVARTEGDRLLELDEKPVHRFFVNAGIYVLAPECLDLIPADTYFDMTQLLDALLASERIVRTYPLRDYWLDIGKMEDFARAVNDYPRYFDPPEES